MMGLTPRQLKLLDQIKLSFAERGYAPSIRELADTMGYRSLGGIHDALECLEERGHIRRLPQRARAIEVLE